MIDPQVEAENLEHQEILLRDIAERRSKNDHEVASFRRDDIHTMALNQKLLNEINELRSISKHKPQHGSNPSDLPDITQGIGGDKKGLVVAVARKKINRLPNVRGMSSPLPPVPAYKTAAV